MAVVFGDLGFGPIASAPIASAPPANYLTLRKFGPGASGAAGVYDFNIVAIRFLPTQDPDKGVPTWQVQLGYNRNYTVQSGNGLAGVVAQDRRNFLSADLRQVSSSDASVKTPSPLAVVKQADTLLTVKADAQAESDRKLTLFKVRRDFVEVDTALTSQAVGLIDLGTVLRVVINRFGYDTGRQMVVTGMLYNAGKSLLTLALWG